MQRETSEGAAYLEALKRASGTSPEESAANAHAKAEASTGPRSNVVEKRRSPRYKCEGSAEMKEEGSEIHTWASFKDISLHGCYVEATATYPVGTNLSLKLAAHGFQVNAKGNVRVNYPYLGMGIAFTEISTDDRAKLRSLVQAAGHSAAVGVEAAPDREKSPGSLPQSFDSGAAVRSVMEFFESHPTLSREEFAQILRSTPAENRLPKV